MVLTLGDRKRLYVFHRLGKVVYLAQNMDPPSPPIPPHLLWRLPWLGLFPWSYRELSLGRLLDSGKIPLERQLLET